MFLSAIREHPLSRFMVVVALFTFAGLLLPRAGVAQTSGETGPGPQITAEQYERLEAVRALMAEGESGKAIEQLDAIIRDYGDSEAILREAYHYLVRIHLAQNDPTMAESKAREGLERFPDLAANELAHPPSVNQLYSDLRSRMFGSLVMITEPLDADIYLTRVGEPTEVHYGKTAKTLPLVAVGEYDLRFARSGYVDHQEKIAVQPGRTLDISRVLKKEKPPWWKRPWVWAVAGATGVVGVVVALIVGGGEEPPKPDPPLDPPPDPPTN